MYTMIHKTDFSKGIAVRKIIFFYITIFYLSIATAYGDNADPAIQWYQKGKKALATKQYSLATENFQKAFNNGYDEARLHHAWGAALYQNGKYEEAELHFEKALGDHEFAQLACLNLGLVALKQNKTDRAISWFLKARDSGDSEKVRVLAEEMLLRMNYRVEELTQQSTTTVYFLMKTGYEDQSYSIALDEVGGSDQFLQLNLYAATRLAGSDYQGFNANLNAFTLQNQKSKNSEVSFAAMQFEYYRKQREWRVNSKLGVTPSYVAGEPYTTSLMADFQLRYRLVKSTILGGLLKYESVKADSAEVDYAAGNVVKTRVQLKHSGHKNLFYIYYQYEMHDLHDRNVGSDFYSYSPTRHLIQWLHRYQLGHAWSIKTRLRYRHSKYSDPNQIGGEVKYRVEDQTQVDLTFGYLVNTRTTLFFGIQHTNNQSSWDQYTYKRNEYVLGIEWLYM